MSLIVLGIETSCDDTSLCLLQGEPGVYPQSPKILGHLSFTQEEILKDFGGVVPEIAARNHQAKLGPLLEQLLIQTKLQLKDIDLIGVTTHPGLLGPLLTGLNTAKTISLIFKTPIAQVNHLFAHIEAIHLSENISYPYLGLIVSGGHSLFVKVTSPSELEILGGTTDDAAGEAFDKGGKLMGLPYPAGRWIDQAAKKGNPKKYAFPIGMRNSKDSQLSFSGLKTSLRLFIENSQITFAHEEQSFFDLCASYQQAIVDSLMLKLEFACHHFTHPFSIVVGGGVACNSALRQAILHKYNNAHFVKPEFCTDNGAMIANFALRNAQFATQYPATLSIDAKSRFIEKSTEK